MHVFNLKVNKVKLHKPDLLDFLIPGFIIQVFTLLFILFSKYYELFNDFCKMDRIG